MKHFIDEMSRYGQFRKGQQWINNAERKATRIIWKGIQILYYLLFA